MRCEMSRYFLTKRTAFHRKEHLVIANLLKFMYVKNNHYNELKERKTIRSV